MSRPKGLRVIAGEHRGRKLVVPEGELVRPTKDRVKEAVFSALDARGAIVDAAVLDLYAGSGALGIEALSRGATNAVLVERERAAIDAIRENVQAIRLDGETAVVASDVGRFLRSMPPAAAPFDLVFVDPPYETTDDALDTLVAAVAAPGWLTDDAILVVERGVGHSPVPPPGLQTLWARVFGDTLIVFLGR